MQGRPYDSGLLLGRFQTFHIGHQSLVDTALNLCDRLVLMVGSAQESGTKRNPYNVLVREEMIKEIYGGDDRVIIYPIPDLSHEDDITTDWGRYVLQHVHTILYKAPELMIYGNDEARSRWFDAEDIKNTAEFIIPRQRIPVAATELRNFMLLDQREQWMKYVNPKLHKLYPKLRELLLTVPHYRDRLQTTLKD